MPIKESFDAGLNQSWGEMLVTNEYYYVILLIDSSQSMLWPFLQDPKNKQESESSDYKSAIKKVQEEITRAHEKALYALRASRICKDRYLKIYQYTFNDKMILLNPPVDLPPIIIPGSTEEQKVVKLTEKNYYPQSITALYDVIYEALLVVDKNYLKVAREEQKRPDKLIIGVITDGDDTYYKQVVKSPEKKEQRIREIKQLMKDLESNNHLYGSCLIGLTSTNFTKERLKEVKEELAFNEAISINQSDDKAIRRAFKMFSTDAAST